jgi:hypothetical protein
MTCAKKISSIVFGLIFWLVASQAVIADVQAQQSIDTVVQRLNELVLVSGKFAQQKKLQGLEYPLSSAGEFIFWKDHGLYLASETPFFNATTMAIDKMIHWQEDGAGSLAGEQNGMVQREVSRTLLAFFSADLALIEERFHTQWQFQADTWILTLTPRHQMVRKQMQSARLQGSEFIQSLQVKTASGDVTDLVFSATTSSPSPTVKQCHWFYLENDRHLCAEFAHSP